MTAGHDNLARQVKQARYPNRTLADVERQRVREFTIPEQAFGWGAVTLVLVILLVLVWAHLI